MDGVSLEELMTQGVSLESGEDNAESEVDKKVDICVCDVVFFARGFETRRKSCFSG